MVSRPTYLPLDTLQRAQASAFAARTERDIWSLSFQADTEADIDGLSALTQLPEPEAAPRFSAPGSVAPENPLPIVQTPYPELRPFSQPPQPTQQQQPAPTPSGTPSAMPGQPPRTVDATIQDGRVTPPTSGGDWRSMPVQPTNAGGENTAPPATGEIDNSSRQSFIRTAWPYVLRAAGGDQSLAELMMAKAISEHGDIGKGGQIIGWNVSGIKGTGDAGSFEADTWEDYGNGRVDIRDRFAAYSGPEAGFGAFMKFLQDNPRYHRALAEYRQTGNAEKLFDDVNAAGYATDPIWSQKLRSIRDTQVAPIVRQQQAADPRQSSMSQNAAAAPVAASSPPVAGPAAPPSGAGLPPSVRERWVAQFGREPTPEESAELMTEMARFLA